MSLKLLHIHFKIIITMISSHISMISKDNYFSYNITIILIWSLISGVFLISILFKCFRLIFHKNNATHLKIRHLWFLITTNK